jgi:hypothetical protein
MRNVFPEIQVARLRLFLACVVPPLLLLCLFQLQQSFETLRYLVPIVRYIAILGAAIIAVQLWQRRAGRPDNPPTELASWNPAASFIVILSSTLSLCLLVLMISWSNGGTLDYSATGGILPWSDARGYFDGAEHVLYEGHLTGFTERRPMNALFLAARLAMTGNNFFGALIVQALFAALALSLATSAILRTHGRTIALIFFVISFSFVGACLHRTLSEPLGITLGLLALALQWSGVANRKLLPYSVGTCVLALALLARAGAMFVLLTSVLFAVLYFAGTWKKRLFVAFVSLSAIAVAWLLNMAMIRLYGTGSEGALLSNFSYTIYGLAQGGVGWVKAVADVQSMGGGNETEVARFLYKRTFETIMTHPTLLIWGLTKSLVVSLATLPIHIFRLIADGSDGSAPSYFRHVAVVAAIMIPAVCLGVFTTLKRLRQPWDGFQLFLIIYLVGFVASLPFFYSDGGIRLTAATFPMTAATIALLFAALASPAEMGRHANVAPGISVVSYAAVAIIIIATLCVPGFSRAMTSSSPLLYRQCSAGEEQLKMIIGKGSAHINVIDDAGGVSFAPNIRGSDFLISDINESKREWQSLASPVTILMGLENDSKALLLIVGPLGFADGPSKLTSLCAERLQDSIFSYRVTH